jgi:branched-chain amino acid transport system ATP-binding protein
MILDEPSEGIQPNVVHQIGEIIIKCNKELGLTTLMVEQHLRLIQQTAQRAYAIDKGIVVGELSKADLMDNAIVNSYLTV